MEQQCFSSSKNQKRILSNFCKILSTFYKNRNTTDCKFVKQFWEWILKICNKKMVRYWQWNKNNYSHENPIKFLAKSIESSLCGYSDPYVLVTGNIAVVGANINTSCI